MLSISQGQCGHCKHFGGEKNGSEQFVQVRVMGQAPGDLVAECGHPTNRTLKLKVSAFGGCSGYEPAAMAMSAKNVG